MTTDHDEMLFIVGAARSGTTYAVDVLGDLFDYGMGPEGHFVPAFARRLRRYGDLAVEANMRRLLADVRNASTLSIIRNEWAPEERFDVSVDELYEVLPSPDYPGVVYAVFLCIARRLGKSRVATKNPSYTGCLPLLESLFPGRAKYINCVRDGRDVALSTMRMSWGQNTAYACARAWGRYIDLATEFEQRVGPARFLNLRYETLVAEPETELARLEAFLGVTLAEEVREGFLARARASDLARNFGKWRTAMPARELERYEAVAGEQLQRWGYERLYPAPRLSLAERAWFEAEELGRKLRGSVAALRA